MKKYFTLVFLFISIQAIQSQESVLGVWKIDYLINLWYNQPEDHEEYNLSPIDNDEEQRSFDWGNWVKFSDDETFISYYTAPCGNDCFPSVYGRFKLLEDDRVLLHVDSIIIGGFCEYQEFYPNKDIGVFKIFAEKSGLKLIKSGTDSEPDSLKLSYSRILDAFERDGINAGWLNQIQWIKLQGAGPKDLIEGLSKVIGYDVSKVKILYSKHLASYKAILFEYNGEKRLAFYSPYSSEFGICDNVL